MGNTTCSSRQDKPILTPIKNFQDLHLRMWIDCKDTRLHWFEAQIIAINKIEKTCTVHYKGWPSNWDEVITENEIENRIARLNTHTNGGVITIDRIAMDMNLDVLDATGRWMEGKIIDIDSTNQLVKICYISFGPYYDEWINYPSYRFAKHGSKCIVNNIELDKQFRSLLVERYEVPLTLIDITYDNNSLFRVVSHQLYGDQNYHHYIREACCNYMSIYSTHFEPLIHIPLDEYVRKLRNGQIGGQVELFAIANLYALPIKIFSVYSVTATGVYNPLILRDDLISKKRPLLISYHLLSNYSSLIEKNSDRLVSLSAGVFEQLLIDMAFFMKQGNIQKCSDIDAEIEKYHNGELYKESVLLE